MKTFAVSVLVLAFVGHSATQLTEDQKQKIQENRLACINETGVDPALIEKADQGEFVEDDKLKCFTKCFYQKGKVMDDNGNVLTETLRLNLPSETMETALGIIKSCMQEGGKDPCDKAFNLHKCYFINSHKERKDLKESNEAPKDDDENTQQPTAKTD